MIVLVPLRKELHASNNRKLISLFLDSNSWISGHIIVLSCLTSKLLKILALFSYHADFSFGVLSALLFVSLIEVTWYFFLN